MASEKSGPGWRPKSATDNRPQTGWRAADPKTAGGSGRTSKLFLLGGLGLAVVVGIVFLILYLKRAERPGIVTIAADPGYVSESGIARLDVPYDPFGWRSGTQLLEWAEKAQGFKYAPKPLGTKPFWLDTNENEWLDQVANDSKIDPVVIYIGLHGGVNATGEPILYTGRDDKTESDIRESDRPAVKLKTILDKLEQKAPKKRKVVILDTGRRLPDPLLGEIYPDFNRAVQEKLGEQIKKTPTLAVILGADDGERGWESADLGMTPLAHFLMLRLSGDPTKNNKDSFTAEDLFASLERNVQQWSLNNRPGAQTPILLPSQDDWKTDAERRRQFSPSKFFLPPEPLPVQSNPVNPVTSNDWKAMGDRCMELAKLTPSPAVYTPVAWRRFRELLLRYEHALTSGDTVGAGVLKILLVRIGNDIEKGLDIQKETVRESVKTSLPLSQALGLPMASADKIRQALTRAQTLDRAATDGKAALGGNNAPVEVHLPVMLNDFVTKVVPGSTTQLEKTWRRAVNSRLLAEQAFVGVRNDTSPFPYSEQLWTVVRSDIVSADALRRRGEDLMLAVGENHTEAALTAFAAADKLYEQTLVNAGKLQRALRIRNDAFADLPFLSRWLSEADIGDIDKKTDRLREAWKKAYELTRLLDGIDPNKVEWASLDAATNRVDEPLTELRRELTLEANKVRNTTSQSDWLAIQHLLLVPPPLVANDLRASLQETSRRITEFLMSDTSQATEANKKGTEPKTDPKKTDGLKVEGQKAERRLKLAADSLAGSWGQWANEQPGLGKPDITASPDKLADTAKQAAIILAHRRAQSAFDKHPLNTATDRDTAETFSRLAAPFSQFAEPAVTNALMRWKTYLEGAAARTALDHWYDERGLPYLTVLSQTFLDDAKKIGTRLAEKSPPDSTDAKDAQRLNAAIGSKALRIQSGDPDGPIMWTTEQDRTFTYTVGPLDYPVPGDAVLWWTLDERAKSLKIDATFRQPVNLQKLADHKSVVTATSGQSLENRVNGRASLQASGYFRGQRLGLAHTTTIEIDNRPDLVITEAQPPPKAAIAMRADFDPGAVAILIDYSGSMTFGWTGGEEGKSKKAIVIQTLKKLLPKLPKTTQLSVRLMHKNETLVAQNSETIFTLDPTNPVITDQGLDDLFTTLDRIPPTGATPLIPCMAKAIADINPSYKGVKTLIVLTDGADTTKQAQVFGNKVPPLVDADKMSDDEKQKMTDLVNRDIEAFAVDKATQDVSIQMVIFGSTEAEEKLASAMFKPVEDESRKKYRGKVHIAKDQQDLLHELDAALRPKVQLLEMNGTPVNKTQTTNIPSNGIPATRTEDFHASGTLVWNGALDTKRYQLAYYTTNRNISFDQSDAMCVAMTKRGTEGEVEFKRELYFKEVDRDRPSGRTTENDEWLLTAPEYGYRPKDGFFLMATAALEGKTGRTPGENGVIRQAKPFFMWWDFTRVKGNAEERFPGTVFVRKAYGLPAPCWRIVADSIQVNPSNQEFRLHTRLFNSSPNSLGKSEKLTGGDLRAGLPLKVSEVTVRAKIETISFCKHPPVDSFDGPKGFDWKPAKCLVVRVTDPRGRLLQVRVSKDTNLPLMQHLYYYEKVGPEILRPKVIGYTAIFGPITDDFTSPRPETEIEVFNVSESLQDDRVKTLTLDLKKPGESPDAVPPIRLVQDGN